jgi:phosphoglycerate dehydrogenase-like enzyme
MSYATVGTSRRLTIGCDLFLPLQLYHVPKQMLHQLQQGFPGVAVVEFNAGRESQVSAEAIEVYWGNRITPSLIARLPSLRWIHFGSVGVDRALGQAVLERGIIVTNSKGVMVAPMVATILAFLCALARGFQSCWQLRAEGRLDRENMDRHFDQIHDLEGETCLIVGLGEVGRRFSNICEALGMRVVAIKRSLASPSPPWVDRLYTLEQLGQAVQEADYVVNLLPLTSSTKEVFHAAVFNKMKPQAFFINVGRGETVKEADLVDALTRRTIAGAGLDVFAHEPLPADSPLWRLSNVILTPHIAGLSQRYWEGEYSLMAENVRRYLRNEPLVNVVDITRGY